MLKGWLAVAAEGGSGRARRTGRSCDRSISLPYNYWDYIVNKMHVN